MVNTEEEETITESTAKRDEKEEKDWQKNKYRRKRLKSRFLRFGRFIGLTVLLAVLLIFAYFLRKV
jgi:predicted lysophospholipase L1 biosynthesis ABC-type transport system permease subunit